MSWPANMLVMGSGADIFFIPPLLFGAFVQCVVIAKITGQA